MPLAACIWGFAMAIQNEIDVRLYYDRWGPTALRYCQFFLGDQVEVEAATQQAFLEVFRSATDLSIDDDQLPADLMKSIVNAATNRSSRFDKNLDTKNFESCIRLLPCAERAVFLMRNTFGLNAGQVADITNTTVEAVNQTCLDAMLRMRKVWLKR